MPAMHKDLLDRQSYDLARELFMAMLADYGYDPEQVVGLRFDGAATGIYDGLQVDVVEDEEADPILVRTYLHAFEPFEEDT